MTELFDPNTYSETLALALFVFWISADNEQDSFSLNDLALSTNFFDGSSHFHILACSFLAF